MRGDHQLLEVVRRALADHRPAVAQLGFEQDQAFLRSEHAKRYAGSTQQQTTDGASARHPGTCSSFAVNLYLSPADIDSD